MVASLAGWQYLESQGRWRCRECHAELQTPVITDNQGHVDLGPL